MVVSFSSVDSRREYLLPRSLYTVLTRMLRVGHCIHNRPQGGGEILPAASANIVIGSNDSLAHQCNRTVVQPFMTSSFAWLSDIAFMAPAKVR